MRLWVAASAVFFAYVGISAAIVPRLARRRRVRAMWWAIAGAGLSGLAHLLPHQPGLHGWILPPALLILGYWASGLLFAGPMVSIERALQRLDSVLGIAAAAARAPAWLAELLELAYLSIYPLIGLALAVHLLGSANPSTDWFWSVVLVTDYACFAWLPWVQTRPPRALMQDPPWRARVRGANLRLLGSASIEVNTFPSGHAAEALAVALLVSDAGAPWTAGLALAAALVSLGAVLGRYHFAADVLAGWAVALAAWVFVPR